jgi:hypothetical protein
MAELSTHARAELARRSSDSVDVTLFWTPGRGADREHTVDVCVCDRRAGSYFEIPAEPHFALDVPQGLQHVRLLRQPASGVVR